MWENMQYTFGIMVLFVFHYMRMFLLFVESHDQHGIDWYIFSDLRKGCLFSLRSPNLHKYIHMQTLRSLNIGGLL